MKALLLICFLLASKTFALAPTQLTEFQDSKMKCAVTKDKVMLFFWATWCVTCKEKLSEKLPAMQAANPNMQILAVNIDTNRKRAAHYLEKHQLNKLPNCLENNREFQTQLNINTSPYWAMLEKKNGKWEVLENEKGFDLDKIKKHLNL